MNKDIIEELRIINGHFVHLMNLFEKKYPPKPVKHACNNCEYYSQDIISEPCARCNVAPYRKDCWEER